MATTPVYLEIGEKSVFAVALDWPGWCRRAKTGDLALGELERYRSRYATIVTGRFTRGSIEVVGTVAGNRTTDFGAPSAISEWDLSPLADTELGRLAGLLADCWDYFERAVTIVPAQLRKGPRGGGRDRDAMVDHVREAERAYASKLGVRIPQGLRHPSNAPPSC